MKFKNTVKYNHRTKRQTLKHKPVYVFGYGSLVNINSLEKTIGKVSDPPIPAIMNKSAGYKRIWSCMESNFGKFSYLNVVKNKNPVPVNGAFIHVKMSQLRNLSRREVHYQIKPVSRKHFTFLNKEIPTDARIYVFINTENKENKHECFLMQSYLDVVMEGFLNYGKKFQDDFVKHTMRNISKNNILQDRKFPIYKNYNYN